VSLEELERHWSLTDLLEAHMALDLRDDVESKAVEAAERQQRQHSR
jgi:hypothetical protein